MNTIFSKVSQPEREAIIFQVSNRASDVHVFVELSDTVIYGESSRFNICFCKTFFPPPSVSLPAPFSPIADARRAGKKTFLRSLELIVWGISQAHNRYYRNFLLVWRAISPAGVRTSSLTVKDCRELLQSFHLLDDEGRRGEEGEKNCESFLIRFLASLRRSESRPIAIYGTFF
jgi:hypothetical protein